MRNLAFLDLVVGVCADPLTEAEIIGSWSLIYCQDDGKGGVRLRGVDFMTVLPVLMALAVLENTLPSFYWPHKIQDEEATVTVLTVLSVLTVMAVSVMTATQLKLNPPFSVILILNA